MLKKLLLSLTVAGLAITSIAANNTNSLVLTNSSLFRAGEKGISLDVGYVSNDYPDQKSTVKKGKKTVTVVTPNNDYDAVVRLGAFYFPFKNFGASAAVPIYTKGDDFEVNTVDAALIGRILPLDSVSAYTKVGTSYNWTEAEYDYFGAVGVEKRLNKTVGVFIEANYQVKDFDSYNLENGQTTIRAGVNIVF